MKGKLIFSVKMRTIALIVASLALAVSVFCVMTRQTTAVSNGKTVVLDAGHGGRDGGVTGINTSVKESDINLAITKLTADFLTDQGYNVVLTRKNSNGLYSVFSKNKKLDDLAKRKEIIIKAQPDLVVSIHQNAFPSPSSSGPQVFFASEETKEIAQHFQKQLNTNLNGRRVVMKGDYYILNCSQYKSVLIECGFLSNAADEQKLISADYQKEVAYSIFSAIHSLLFENDLPYLI